jgi:hypothetical protein
MKQRSGRVGGRRREWKKTVKREESSREKFKVDGDEKRRRG